MEKIELKSCRKKYTYDQDKAIMPDDTVRIAKERIKRFEHPLVEKFYKVENEFGIPVYRLECSKYVPNEYPLFEGTWGQGAIDSQAQASGIMEFVERFSASRYKKWFKSKYADFAPGAAIPMECWGNSLDYFESDRPGLLESAKGLTVCWGEAYNLISNESVFVPKIFFDTCTTGLSAGNTFEEALLQAMCECVDRHVSAHIYRHHGEYPTVDKATISNEVILDLIKKIEVQGIEITVKDFSSVTGIPAIGIILTSRSDPGYIIGQSLGVYPDREKALMRTLTKQVQGSTIAKMKPRLGGSDFFRRDKPEEVKSLLKGKKIRFDAVTDLRSEDIKQEIESFLRVLGGKGFEPVFMDMTEPTLGIPVIWVYLKNAFLIFLTRPLPFTIARAAIETEEYRKGIEYLMRQVEKDSDKIPVYYNIGYCHYSLKEYDKAAYYYERARKDAFNSKEYVDKDQDGFLEHIYSALGNCYMNLERYREAVDNFEKAKEYEKRSSFIYLNLGLCYFKTDKFREALDNYEKGMEIDPSITEEKVPHAEMGICCLELGIYDKAITHFNCMVKSNPDDWLVYHFLGTAHRGVKDYAKAIEYFKKSIGLNPGEWNNYNILGATYRESGDLQKAAEALREAIRLNPKEWRNYNVLGNTLMMLEHNGESMEMFGKALELCDDAVYAGKIKDNITAVKKKNREDYFYGKDKF